MLSTTRNLQKIILFQFFFQALAIFMKTGRFSIRKFERHIEGNTSREFRPPIRFLTFAFQVRIAIFIS